MNKQEKNLSLFETLPVQNLEPCCADASCSQNSTRGEHGEVILFVSWACKKHNTRGFYKYVDGKILK